MSLTLSIPAFVPLSLSTSRLHVQGLKLQADLAFTPAGRIGAHAIVHIAKVSHTLAQTIHT